MTDPTSNKPNSASTLEGQKELSAQEEFAKIGQALKEAREARGLSPQDVADNTRIHPRYIEAIEAGDLKTLPGIAFVRGFVRNYEEVVPVESMNVSAAMAKLDKEAPQIKDPTLAPPSAQRYLSQAPPFPWKSVLLIVLVLLVVIWLGYVAIQMWQSAEPDPEPPAAVEMPQPTPANPVATDSSGALGTTDTAESAGDGTTTGEGGPAAEGSEEGTGGEGQPPGSDAAPTNGASATVPSTLVASGLTDSTQVRQKLRLTLRGVDVSWVRLVVDNAPPVDILVEKGETMTWEAEDEFRLTLGRSQGVAVYLNGEQVMLAAEPNQLIPNLVLNQLYLLKMEN